MASYGGSRDQDEELSSLRVEMLCANLPDKYHPLANNVFAHAPRALLTYVPCPPDEPPLGQKANA